MDGEADVYLVVDALMSTADAPSSFTTDQREKLELAKSGFQEMIRLIMKGGAIYNNTL